MRFPLTAQIRYIAVEGEDRATLQDISSGGVFLKIARTLRIGNPIRVFIDWPARLDDRCLLRLMIDGKVIRSDHSGTAVRLTRYEYRTRSTRTP